MTLNVLQAIKQRWLELGVGVRPGLDDAAVDAFERQYCVRLPAAMRSFYKSMGGMSQGCWDDDLIAFWPLSEVGSVSTKLSGFRGVPDYGGIERVLPDAASWFIFADHSIWVWVYAIKLSMDPAAAPVIWISGNEWGELAPSFEDFLDRYAQNPRLLFAR